MSQAIVRALDHARGVYRPAPVATAFVLALVLSVAFEVAALGFSIRGWTGYAPLVLAAVFGVAYGSLRGIEQRLLSQLVVLALFVIVTQLGEMLSYAWTARGGAIVYDQALLDADRALGFDWCAFTAFFVQSDLMESILRAAYMTIGLQVAVTAGVFVYKHDRKSVDAMLIALIIVIFITVVGARFLPAGGISSVWPQVSQVMPGTADAGAYANYVGLRSGALRVMDFDAGMPGVVSFPSVHAAIAVLIPFAAWRADRRLFWVIAALDVLMMISTITHGGHYLVDVISGTVAATLAWVVALQIAERRPSFLRTRSPATVSITQ